MEDVNQVANRFLEVHFGERAQNIVPVAAAGDWSRAYFFTLDERQLVIRFGAYREDFEKDRVMSRYSLNTLPIPKVLEVGETEGGFYAISERVSGKPLDDLDGPEIQLVLPQLFHGLYELQKLDLTKAQEVGLWRPDGAGLKWADGLLSVVEPRDRLPGWREKLDASPQDARVFDSGLERMRHLAPQLPEYRGIVHNDLLYRNVLVDAGKLTGVIDWGNAIYGDPLYDIACFVYKWPWYPKWQGVDLQEILDRHWDQCGGQPPHIEERLLCYLIHIGLCDMKYYAFRERPEDMRRQAERLLNFILEL